MVYIADDTACHGHVGQYVPKSSQDKPSLRSRNQNLFYFILFYVLDVIHRRFAEQPALLSLSPGPYQDPYYVPYRRTDFVGVLFLNASDGPRGHFPPPPPQSIPAFASVTVSLSVSMSASATLLPPTSRQRLCNTDCHHGLPPLHGSRAAGVPHPRRPVTNLRASIAFR